MEAVPCEPWFASTDDRIDAQRASELQADLDGETREAIVARLRGGLTFEEISRLQGCEMARPVRRGPVELSPPSLFTNANTGCRALGAKQLLRIDGSTCSQRLRGPRTRRKWRQAKKG
jgi:hypothetical protein